MQTYYDLRSDDTTFTRDTLCGCTILDVCWELALSLCDPGRDLCCYKSHQRSGVSNSIDSKEPPKGGAPKLLMDIQWIESSNLVSDKSISLPLRSLIDHFFEDKKLLGREQYSDKWFTLCVCCMSGHYVILCVMCGHTCIVSVFSPTMLLFMFAWCIMWSCSHLTRPLYRHSPLIH